MPEGPVDLQGQPLFNLDKKNVQEVKGEFQSISDVVNLIAQKINASNDGLKKQSDIQKVITVQKKKETEYHKKLTGFKDNYLASSKEVGKLERAMNKDIWGRFKLSAKIAKQSNLTGEQKQKFHKRNIAALIAQNRERAKELIRQKATLAPLRGGLKIMEGIAQIPIVGKLVGASEAAEVMRDRFKESGSVLQSLGAGIMSMGKSLMKNIVVGVVTFLIKGVLEFNKQMVGLQRQFLMTREEAGKFRDTLSVAADKSGDILANELYLQETNAKINQLRGSAVVMREQDLITANRIVKAEVMSVEATAELAKMSNIHGKNIKETYRSQIRAAKLMMNERKVRLDFKSVLEATNKVSGQIRAQLGANPEAIAKAVTLAKSFGMELEDIKGISSALLDFEGSIAKELEAELLTGKELNLERARLAALTGDYDTLMKEINANVGDFYEFSQLNVLQQDALAQSLGMSSDQLSEMLLKEADLEAMKAKAIEDNDKDLQQKLEQLTLQQEFNAAIVKLKQALMKYIVPNIEEFVTKMKSADKFASNLGDTIKTVVNGALDAMGYILTARIGQMGVMMAMQAAIAGMKYGAIGALVLTGALIGGSWLLINQTKQKAEAMFSSAEDAMIDPDGGLVVSGKKGTIQLDPEDQIIAGTDLGGMNKKGLMSEMVSELKLLRDDITNLQIAVNVNVTPDRFAGRDAEYGKIKTDAMYDSFYD
jgi:hypothetical protein